MQIFVVGNGKFLKLVLTDVLQIIAKDQNFATPFLIVLTIGNPPRLLCTFKTEQMGFPSSQPNKLCFQTKSAHKGNKRVLVTFTIFTSVEKSKLY